MNDELTCAQIEELMPSYVVDALVEEERCSFLAHLAECRRHDDDMAAYRALESRLTSAIDPVAPAAQVRSSLLRSFDALVAAGAPAEEATSRPASRGRVLRLMRAPVFAYGLAAAFARKLTAEVLRRGLKPGVLLNVNVPNLPEEECAGVRLTRQGKRIYGDAIVEKIDPRGREYYWIGGNGLSWVEERGTDFDAVAHRAISVTPIRLDLTDFDALRELERWDFR